MQERIEDIPGQAPSAFEELFAREYRGVVAAAQRIVGPTGAEDIAQEAFALLYRRGPLDANHARNWLYRAALHRAISALRAEQRRQHRENRLAQPESLVEEPAVRVEQYETRASVNTVLQRMHSRYAVVLALRHSGMSYKEIAAIMHVKVNQVGTLLVRAEAAFKKEFNRVSSFR